MQVILISGLIPFDSGKTWFTIGAAAAAKELGLRVSVYKPVAAHNIWYSPHTVDASSKLGILVGNDALLYYRHGLAPSPHISNPIAIATSPPDPTKYTRYEDYEGDFEDISRVAVITRITTCRSGSPRHFVHRDNLSKVGGAVSKLAEGLASSLRAEPLDFGEVLSYISSPRAAEDLDYCMAELSRGADLLLVESFNDAISPYPGVLSAASALIVIAPGKAIVYEDMNRVRKAVEELAARAGQEGLRARRLFNEVPYSFAIDIEPAREPAAGPSHIDLIKRFLGP